MIISDRPPKVSKGKPFFFVTRPEVPAQDPRGSYKPVAMDGLEKKNRKNKKEAEASFFKTVR
jgi:hypothetical protein